MTERNRRGQESRFRSIDDYLTAVAIAAKFDLLRRQYETEFIEEREALGPVEPKPGLVLAKREVAGGSVTFSIYIRPYKPEGIKDVEQELIAILAGTEALVGPDALVIKRDSVSGRPKNTTCYSIPILEVFNPVSDEACQAMADFTLQMAHELDRLDRWHELPTLSFNQVQSFLKLPNIIKRQDLYF